MVYCGSGTETRKYNVHNFKKIDPMVYCGSGTETKKFAIFLILKILWSTAEAVLRLLP